MEHVQEKLAVSSVRASDARAVDEYFKGVRIVSVSYFFFSVLSYT